MVLTPEGADSHAHNPRSGERAERFCVPLLRVLRAQVQHAYMRKQAFLQQLRFGQDVLTNSFGMKSCKQLNSRIFLIFISNNWTKTAEPNLESYAWIV